MVSGKGYDVEGVLASVDGLKKRLQREPLRRRLEQRQLAGFADLVVAGNEDVNSLRCVHYLR